MTTATETPVVWIRLSEVIERGLAPAPNTDALCARIRRHNNRFPMGHKQRIRTQRGYVALNDLKTASWNSK